MRLNRNTVQKLKAGHTVWRCLIWFDDRGRFRSGLPRVEIEELFMRGRRFKKEHVLGRMYVESSLQGNIHYYLADISYAHAYTARREALAFEQRVLSGQESTEVENRRSALNFN